MLFEADKVMFEIYRDKTYTGKFCVVYYTELDDHNKEHEINRAMAGESFYDGFLKNFTKEEGKQVIDRFLERLNRGEKIEPAEISAGLGELAAT